MILPDVNVLVHAHNANSVVHERARRWWDACLSGAEGVGLAWAVILGLVRITTNRKVVARPLPVQEVLERLHAWLALPQVHIAQPSETHFTRLRAELERLGTAANPYDRRPPRRPGDGTRICPLLDGRRFRPVCRPSVGQSVQMIRAVRDPRCNPVERVLARHR